DWNYDMWRCDAWNQKLCSVWEFGETPPIRDGCTACIADCYRDSSVMLHFAVSLGDAIDDASDGHIWRALKKLFNRQNLVSLGAIAENAGVLSRLARLGCNARCGGRPRPSAARRRQIVHRFALPVPAYPKYLKRVSPEMIRKSPLAE